MEPGTGSAGHLPNRVQRDHWLRCDDAALLAECRVDTYRAGGPGGQHRNKVSSAVRLRHEPTGLVVIAEEERSQHANKARAVKRLRLAIALNVRAPFDGPADAPLEFRQHVSRDGRLVVAGRNPAYPVIVAAALDAIAVNRGQLREAAVVLGITTSQLSRFVTGDGKVQEAANRLRREAGLRALTTGR